MRKSSLLQWFKNISIKKKLYFSVGVMAFLIAMELFTLLFFIRTLSSVRALVGAEGLWSKAQKDAIYNLRKYARSGKEEDYHEFLHFLKVPLGDRKTRIEMGKANSDINILRNGFIEGRNHPDDIDGMIKLLSRFHSISYINKAIQIWTKADLTISEMQKYADDIHTTISTSGVLSQQKTDENLKKINEINKKLTVLEDEFSYTLGEGSRWLENLILNILLIIAFTVEVSGLLITISISKNISKGINEIIRVSEAVAEGKLDTKAVVYSRDEIGLLATSFNKMIVDLEGKISALKESEEKFYTIFHSSSIGMTISNFSDKKMIEVNDRFLKSLGYSKEEVIGKTSIEIGIVADLLQRKKVLEIVNDMGRTPDFELDLRTKSGKIINALISVTVMEINGEKCVVSIYYDITEKKQIEIALQKKSEQLIHSNKELEHFAYIASHDLQEPLRTISNYVGLFQSKYKNNLDETADEFLQFISGATVRMQELIKDLLDYSRIGFEKKLIEIHCNELLQTVLFDLSKTIKENNCQIKIEPLPVLKGYSELKSLFQNLISNAIKYRKKDTKTIITVSANELKNEWLFAVKDNGIGIDSLYHERIFIIFQKLHTQREYAGTGIGLAQCKKIVDLHGGKIWVESELEKGSTFYFTIPKKIKI